MKNQNKKSRMTEIVSEKIRSKDAKKVRNFDITVHRKGFISSSVINEIVSTEYFQYREIHQILHHPGKGVEIVGYNDNRRVFYNDENGASEKLYNAIFSKMLAWMNSNLN